MFDISLNILDIAENSVKAGASLVTIHLISGESNGVKVIITDNGCGIDKSIADALIRGEYKGHGIDRLNEAVTYYGGEMTIESQSGVGTVVTAEFPQAMPEVANIEATVMALAANDCGARVVFKAEHCGSVFRVDTRDYEEDGRVTSEAMLKIKRSIVSGLKNLSEDLKQ